MCCWCCTTIHHSHCKAQCSLIHSHLVSTIHLPSISIIVTSLKCINTVRKTKVQIEDSLRDRECIFSFDNSFITSSLIQSPTILSNIIISMNYNRNQSLIPSTYFYSKRKLSSSRYSKNTRCMNGICGVFMELMSRS